jgi:hypothetical protein
MGPRRETDLLPVPYYHMVFTLPAASADDGDRVEVALLDQMEGGLSKQDG